MHDRGALVYRALRGIGVPIDMQMYTKCEFEERAGLPVSSERTMQSNGRLPYAA